MIKQQLTQERAERIFKDTVKIALYAKMIENVHAIDRDTEFKDRNIANFYRRIGKDAIAVNYHIRNSGKYKLSEINVDETIDAAVVIDSIVDILFRYNVPVIESIHKQLLAESEMLEKERHLHHNKEQRNDLINKIYDMDLEDMTRLNKFIEKVIKEKSKAKAA